MMNARDCASTANPDDRGVATMDRLPASRTLLRDVTEADLPTLFEHQRDPDANHMVAFTARDPDDRDAFMAHWAKILRDDLITKQIVEFEGQVAGSILCFEDFGKPSIGYWLGRAYWGKGIATEALAEF